MRDYYARRVNQGPVVTAVDLEKLRALVLSCYKHFAAAGFFADAFGYACVDSGTQIHGYTSPDLAGYFFRRLRKMDLFPVPERMCEYSESDLFSVIEFLYDHVSKPTRTESHGYDNCCVHFYDFDLAGGRLEFRTEVNTHLKDYGVGFELSADGEIVEREPGFAALFEARLPTDIGEVSERMDVAVRKFRRYSASESDQREAVRLLADCLEFLRPEVKRVLTRKDDADLFNIANNFGIRHSNAIQKTDYDAKIWLRWMFYYYLATLHAATRLVKKASSKA